MTDIVSPAVTPQTKRQIARPLKVLVPLIKDELAEADAAGLEHYRRAGEMLNEARDSGQVAYGSWGRWLKTNFELSSKVAYRYMHLARMPASVARDKTSLSDAIGEKRSRSSWKPLFDAADSVNVNRLAEERQSRDDERKLAMRLIDIGFKVLANELHPDKGGSRDAMSLLNRVRDRLRTRA